MRYPRNGTLAEDGLARKKGGTAGAAAKALVQEFAPRLDATVGFLVWDTSRGFQRAATPMLARHGISFGWYHFLRILSEKDGLTMRELSDAAHVRGPTAVEAVRELERRHFVVRHRDRNDRRKVNVHLTAKGRAACDAILPISARVNRLGVAGLSRAQLATFLRLLHVIRTNIYREVERLEEEEAAIREDRRRLNSIPIQG